MSVLSIKVPIPKKSGNILNDPFIYIHIYIYIYYYYYYYYYYWQFVIYIYIYIIDISSSSSSCRAACADIPDRLSPFLPIIHRLRQVFSVTSRVLTQLLYVGSCWSSHSCTSMCGGPQEYIAYELVLASPAVSCVSGSSNLYSFCDGGQVSV